MFDLDQKRKSLESSIEAAQDFLFQNQLHSGEFLSYRGRDLENEIECEPDSSVFPSALIAYSLQFIDSEKSLSMQEKVVNFLKKQILKDGVWRYWTREHPYHTLIPPDVDDTVCASSILEQNNIPLIENKATILANTNKSGLLYTWFSPRWDLKPNFSLWKIAIKQAINPIKLYYFWKLNESEPHDIDSVVNANALFYLGKSPETEPIIEFLSGIIEEEREESADKWHLSRFNLYYAISKCAYHGIEPFDRVKQLIVSRIKERTDSDGIIGDNILETALAVCTLQNFRIPGPEYELSAMALLENQNENGSWKKLPLYYGGPEKYYGWGSQELTTGFCLEALNRYAQSVG